MAYTSWSVVFGEQPSAAKWNILGANDASFNDGTGFPAGAVVQTVNTKTGAVATGTTVIPFDDTIPQITEGTEFMTLAITPRSATNILVINVVAHLSNSFSGINDLSAALFQDATANALAATNQTMAGTLFVGNFKMTHTMTAGTASSTTFRVRGGAAQAGTTTFNGQSGARKFGGVFQSSIVITEYKV